jgi:hypothetical protein
VWIIELASVNLLQVGIGVVAVAMVALVLWRVLKRAIGGCVSMGVGCLVLVVGLVAVGFYFAQKSGVTNFDDLIRLIGF